MNRNHSAEGIVISRRNFGEADKLISIFTKQYGKKVILAKGIRKISSRRSPHLELFSQIRFIFHDNNNLPILTEVASINTFAFIRNRLERVGMGYIVLELVEKLTAENQASREIYDLLVNFLTDLSDIQIKRSQMESRLTEFKFRILGILGFIRQDVIWNSGQLDQQIAQILEKGPFSQKFLNKIRQ